MNSGLSKPAMLRIIQKAHADLPALYVGFGNIIDRLTREACESERQHRRHSPAVRGFSVKDAGRYFAVKYLREYALGAGHMPTLRDYLSIRQECFLAAAIVCNFESEIRQWAERVDMAFDSIDYCVLMGGD